MNTTIQVLLYGLVAGFSPLALLSTLAVLGSGRGRANGTAFGAGFLLAQSVALIAVLVLGSVATPSGTHGHETLAALLELGLGAAMLVFAWQGRRPRGPVERSGQSRTKALLARLGEVRLGTALSVGFLLGIGGVKRLTLTILAGTTIAVSGLAQGEEVALGILYVLIATALVWAPVLLYLVAGRGADAWTEKIQTWLTANQRRATVLSTLFFGFLLIGHALVVLL